MGKTQAETSDSWLISAITQMELIGWEKNNKHSESSK